jgi:hypothetical protein
LQRPSGPEELAGAVFPANSGAVYQSSDILSTLFHSINLNIPSIEALKLVNPSDLGICMGMNQLPEKETIKGYMVFVRAAMLP